MFVLPKIGKSGQKTVNFLKSGKQHYTKYWTFWHPKISNQAIFHTIDI